MYKKLHTDAIKLYNVTTYSFWLSRVGCGKQVRLLLRFLLQTIKIYFVKDDSGLATRLNLPHSMKNE
jgi:hypothetical protein